MFQRERPLVVIGTHHKAGTNWLAGIFRAIAQGHLLALYEGPQLADLGRYDMFFQDHSHFTLSALRRYRGLHMVRDPRDVIVSGCFYHQRADEPWLHVPRPRFGGLSYMERLNGLATPRERLLFEMEHIGRVTLGDMSRWNYRNRRFFEVRYERLIEDRRLDEFRRVFAFLRRGGSALGRVPMDGLLELAHDHSLFSGKVARGGHIRSGAPEQWREHFDERLARRFLELFGDLLVRLGYEPDHRWAGDLAGLRVPRRPPRESLDIFDVLDLP